MRRVLILDVETTGLDPKADQAIEVGAILYSVEHATTLAAASTLIRSESNAAEAINRIPAAALIDAPEAGETWAQIEYLAVDGAGTAEAILAHGADFDRAFVSLDLRERLPWICTRTDIAWPKAGRPGGTLVSLALEHDLGVSVAHRALADCDLIARLLTRCHELGHDLQAMLERGLRPKVTLQAVVPYEGREIAKAAGFHWHAGRKQWLRRMVREDAEVLDFPVRVVSDEEPGT